MPWMFLAVAVAFEVAGTSALQASQQFTRLVPSVFVVLCYGLAFYFLSHVMRTMPVGLVYALWSGLGITLIAVVGWLVFGQRLDLPAVLGIGLILAGIVVINVFSGASPH